MFVHRISSLINNNIDLVLTSSFLGLSQVVIYSSYNFIVNSIKKITSKIYVAVIPIAGNLLVSSKDRSKEIFFEFNAFAFFMAIIITIPLMFSISPFIRIWYEGKIEISTIYSLLFPMILFWSIIFQPLLAYTEASGLFKQTQNTAIIDMILNLVLSIVLINYLGIVGILLATIIAHIISNFIMKPRIIFKNLYKETTTEYYKQSLFFIAVYALLIFSQYFLYKNIVMDNMSSWFLYSMLVFVCNFIITYLIFKVFNKKNFTKR